ncbi:hypothetical protein BDZ89DRAFT_1115206 [Hymenopellis radicata]|nr:hypothetical protein BDZ89DRAFT_1115206 [Hymenopellis radicata]
MKFTELLGTSDFNYSSLLRSDSTTFYCRALPLTVTRYTPVFPPVSTMADTPTPPLRPFKGGIILDSNVKKKETLVPLALNWGVGDPNKVPDMQPKELKPLLAEYYKANRAAIRANPLYNKVWLDKNDKAAGSASQPKASDVAAAHQKTSADKDREDTLAQQQDKDNDRLPTGAMKKLLDEQVAIAPSPSFHRLGTETEKKEARRSMSIDRMDDDSVTTPTNPKDTLKSNHQSDNDDDKSSVEDQEEKTLEPLPSADLMGQFVAMKSARRQLIITIQFVDFRNTLIRCEDIILEENSDLSFYSMRGRESSSALYVQLKQVVPLILQKNSPSKDRNARFLRQSPRNPNSQLDIGKIDAILKGTNEALNLLSANMYEVADLGLQEFGCTLFHRTDDPSTRVAIPEAVQSSVAKALFPSHTARRDCPPKATNDELSKMSEAERKGFDKRKDAFAAAETARSLYQKGDSQLSHEMFEMLRTEYLKIDFRDEKFEALHATANNRLVVLQRRKLFETCVLDKLRELGWHKGTKGKFTTPMEASHDEFSGRLFSETDLYGFFGFRSSQAATDKRQFGPDARQKHPDIDLWWQKPNDQEMQAKYMGLSASAFDKLVKGDVMDTSRKLSAPRNRNHPANRKGQGRGDHGDRHNQHRRKDERGHSREPRERGREDKDERGRSRDRGRDNYRRREGSSRGRSIARSHTTSRERHLSPGRQPSRRSRSHSHHRSTSRIRRGSTSRGRYYSRSRSRSRVRGGDHIRVDDNSKLKRKHAGSSGGQSPDTVGERRRGGSSPPSKSRSGSASRASSPRPVKKSRREDKERRYANDYNPRGSEPRLDSDNLDE